MKKASTDNKNFEATFPIDIDSKEGKEYLNILHFGLEYALLNRMEMAKKIHKVLEKVLGEKIDFRLIANKTHNHVEFSGKNLIHRKGATSSNKDELGVIPGNMRDGSYIIKGKGNKDFLNSSSHGAGRKMSRKQAKKNISMEDFKLAMKGITGVVKEATIDEAPQAYKDVNEVMKKQKDSVEVISHIKPIINWKG
jgi:tRNA-splicing ligase RtcB